MIRLFLLALFCGCVFALYVAMPRCSEPSGQAPHAKPDRPGGRRKDGEYHGRILFLTTSAGYRHEVVTRPAPDELSLAEKELTDFCSELCDVDCSQDPADINAKNLARYDAVVFYTTGELAIPDEGKRALLEYVRTGGGFAGIHPATDTFYGWPEYGELIGGRFDQHPWHQKVRIRREDGYQGATTFLKKSFEITDEIYQFKDWRRNDMHVLLSLDTSSVDLTRPNVHRTDGDFAIAWWRPYGRGRVFYTALGHRPEVWKDSRFRIHVTLGIKGVMRGERQRGPFDREGFQQLHADRGMDEWFRIGQGLWGLVERDPPVVASWGEPTFWFWREESWRNFVLRASFRVLEEGGTASVVVRIPAVEKTLETVDAVAPHIVLGEGALAVEVGETWHDLEIEAVGPKLVIRLDGTEVESREDARSLVGHVALRSHDGPDFGCEIRNLRVKRLPD